MYSVSSRFLTALTKPHKLVTVCTVTTPDDEILTVDLKAGSISVDGASRIRRRGTLTAVGGSDVFETITTPGALFQITHGINFGSSSELVPVFTGELLSGSQKFGDGTIGFTVVDRAQWLSRTRFLTPYAPLSSLTRVAAITAVVQAAIPGVTVTNTSSDVGTIGSAQVWTDGPLDVISDLTRDGGTEAFFGPDGVFTIRDQATSTSTPVWTASSGDGGVLTSAERTRPIDRMFNTVVVRPAATDASQTWTQQAAQISDTSNPRHPDYVGVVPYFWSSPTLLTTADASLAAQRILDKTLGTTETLALELISNPALEANESIRVITPLINLEPAQIFQHFIDSFTLDLRTGGMSVATRSQGVVTDG